MEIGAKMAHNKKKVRKYPKSQQALGQLFHNSLKSLAIMLRTAPGVKLPSYRKKGFNACWWRCVLYFRQQNRKKLIL